MAQQRVSKACAGALLGLLVTLTLPAAADGTYTRDDYRSARDHRHHDPALERRTYLGAGARRDSNAQNRRYQGLSQRHPDSRDEYHGARRNDTPHVRDDHRAGPYDNQRQGYSGRSNDGNRGYRNNRGYDGNRGYRDNRGYDGNRGYRDNRGYDSNRSYDRNRGYDAAPRYGINSDRGRAPGYRYDNGRGAAPQFDYPSLQRGPSVPQPLRRYRDR